MTRREPYEPALAGRPADGHGAGLPLGPTIGAGGGGAVPSPPPIRRDHEVPAVTGELAPPLATPDVPEFDPPRPASKRVLRPPRRAVPDLGPVTTKASGGTVVTFPPKSAPGWQDAVTIGDRTDDDLRPAPVDPVWPPADAGSVLEGEDVGESYPGPGGVDPIMDDPDGHVEETVTPAPWPAGVMEHDTIPPEALASLFGDGLERAQSGQYAGNHDWLPDELYGMVTTDIAAGAARPSKAEPDTDGDLDALLAELSAVAEDRRDDPGDPSDLEAELFGVTPLDDSSSGHHRSHDMAASDAGPGHWFDELSAEPPPTTPGSSDRIGSPDHRSPKRPSRRPPTRVRRAPLSARYEPEPDSVLARLRTQVEEHWSEPVGLAVVIVVVALVVLIVALFALG